MRGEKGRRESKETKKEKHYSKGTVAIDIKSYICNWPEYFSKLVGSFWSDIIREYRIYLG